MIRHVRKIAVTGGIGCGKSVIIDFFAGQGIPVADADAVCHQLYRDPVWIAEVVRQWGPEMIRCDGSLDRGALSAKVFAAPEEVATLNRMVHPEIRRRLQLWLAEQERLAVVEVPLLFESGWRQDFDDVIAVWSPPVLCTERVRGRGWSATELEQRLARQWTPERKLEAADYGIINHGSMEMLKAQCAKVLTHLSQSLTQGN